MPMDTIVTPLRRWRTRTKLTQREVAKLLGVSKSRYSEIEAGATCRWPLALKIHELTKIPLKRLADAPSERAA